MASTWICLKTKKPYTPSKGEIARLNYWGVSGNCECPDCSGIPATKKTLIWPKVVAIVIVSVIIALIIL